MRFEETRGFLREFNLRRPRPSRSPLLLFVMAFVDCLYRFVRSLALLLGTVFLLFATGLINLRFKRQISASCATFNSTRAFDECASQRQSTFLFVVYCVVRIFSHKWEQYVLASGDKECITRKLVPGMHLGAPLGIPFLIRNLYMSLGIGANPLFVSALLVSSAVAFFPFAKDFFLTVRLFSYGLRRRIYKANRAMVVTFILLYLYFSFLVLLALDVSIGLFCPDYNVLGLPLLFPNVNHPLIFFLVVLFVTSHHKKMAVIIYEVHAEDCFVHLQRMRCLCLKDCPEKSIAIYLSEIPSQTTTQQRRNFDGRIVQIRDLRELESLLPCRLPPRVADH